MQGTRRVRAPRWLEGRRRQCGPRRPPQPSRRGKRRCRAAAWRPAMPILPLHPPPIPSLIDSALFQHLPHAHVLAAMRGCALRASKSCSRGGMLADLRPNQGLHCCVVALASYHHQRPADLAACPRCMLPPYLQQEAHCGLIAHGSCCYQGATDTRICTSRLAPRRAIQQPHCKLARVHQLALSPLSSEDP